jgi:UDP-N-acetylmuramoylalanine--D-glutamate ligase
LTKDRAGLKLPPEVDKTKFRNRILEHYPAPFCIVGEGISGLAVKGLFEALEFTPDKDFCTYDDKSPHSSFNDSTKLIHEFKPRTLIVSPGVPLKTAWIQKAKQEGLKISSELSIASLVLSNERVIGVTGSLGKSTTVSILGSALRRFSETGFVGGNLGTPLAIYAKELVLGTRAPADWLVLELSSFQLENFDFLPIHQAAVTYLSSNHLERYTNLEEYYRTKWQLVERCQGSCVINRKGGDLQKYANQNPGKTLLQAVDQQNTALSSTQLQLSKLVGRHNWDNLAVAYAVAQNCDWPDYSIQGMLDFRGLSHRMQNVGTFNGVTFINDSKATTMESVLTATEALLSETEGASKNIFLLLGGKDKKLPWHQLSKLAIYSNLIFLFFGECAEIARTGSGLKGEIFVKLEHAVRAIKPRCKNTDMVLLSPGGSSLDEFKNFEERGQKFSAYAKELFS